MNEGLENQILVGEKYYSKDYLYKIGKEYKTNKLGVLLGLGITFLMISVNFVCLFLSIYFDDPEVISDLFWLPFFMLVYFFAPGLVFTIIACQGMKKSRCVESGITIIKNQKENIDKKVEKTELIKAEIQTPKFYQSVSLQNKDIYEEDEEESDEENDEDIDEEESEHNIIVLEALRLKAIQMGWDEEEMSLEEFISYFM